METVVLKSSFTMKKCCLKNLNPFPPRGVNELGKDSISVTYKLLSLAFSSMKNVILCTKGPIPSFLFFSFCNVKQKPRFSGTD